MVQIHFCLRVIAPQWSAYELASDVLHGVLDIECYMLRARSYVVSQGTIKKITDKGFGFIQGDRGDIFFHSSAVVESSFDALREGQVVEYSEGRGPKGPCAENVKLVS